MQLDVGERFTWGWCGDARLLQNIGDQVDSFFVRAPLVEGTTHLAGNRLFPIEGVGPDFAVVGASVRG
jgi:hypothetical protein